MRQPSDAWVTTALGNRLGGSNQMDPTDEVFDKYRYVYDQVVYNDSTVYSQINFSHPGWVPGWLVPGTVRFYTYGSDTGSNQPLPFTRFGQYHDSLTTYYGSPNLTKQRPLKVLPEDARSIVFDTYPTRINHARNPDFNPAYDVGLNRWTHFGGAAPVEFDQPLWRQQDKAGTFVEAFAEPGLPPYGVKANGKAWGLEVNPGSRSYFGTFGEMSGMTWLSETSPDGTSGSDSSIPNWWKIAFVTDSREAVYGGLYLLDELGGTTLREVEFFPQPLPWDVDDRRIYGPTGGCQNPYPYSKSGWYIMYGVFDAGKRNKWATPVVGMRDWGSHPAIITNLCMERWDTVDLLRGPIVSQYDRFGALLPQEQFAYQAGFEPLEHSPNTYDNVALDPLPVFHADMPSRHSQDFVWLGELTEGTAVSAYFPQRVERTFGYEKLIRNWLPVGRSESIRYTYEAP